MSKCIECNGSGVAERDPSGGFKLDCPCCEGTGEQPEYLYTSAPESYDGFGTKTIAIVGKDTFNGLPVRAVEIRPEHYDWQTTRYGSGSHRYTHERCSVDDYVRFGDWILDPEQKQEEPSQS